MKHALVLVFATATAAASAQAPKVEALQPPHMDPFVDPVTTRQLVVTFDRAMDPRAHALCGGGPSFPRVLGTSWSDERTFVAEVQLAEDQVYSMDLSCAGSGGFLATNGERLPLVPWRIATAGKKLDAEVMVRAVDALFDAIANSYSYRDRLGVDWSETQKTAAATLLDAPCGAALALRIADLLQVAQDPHVTVQWKDAVLPTWQRNVQANFDVRGLQKVMRGLARIGRIGLQTRTEDGIGYLLVGSFAREHREDFESVLEAARKLLDCKAIVLDVRTNGGGDELMARRLAAYFVAGEHVYAAHRIRDARAEGGFQPRQERRVHGNEPPNLFAGPVAVLTGPINMSSCEAFLLMMKQAPRAILVGGRSWGSSGNPQPRVLAPGLTVMLPSWQALGPDGSVIEGEGIAPHIHVEAPPSAFVDGDPVLDEALLRLRAR